MEDMREAIRIEQVLRGVCAPGIPRPQVELAAGTPPQASLATELIRRDRQDCDDCRPRPEVFPPAGTGATLRLARRAGRFPGCDRLRHRTSPRPAYRVGR